MNLIMRNIKWITNISVLLIAFGLYQSNEWDKEENQEVVSFTVQAKYAKGYSGKYSNGEYFYLKLYSAKYDRYVYKEVHPLDYLESSKGSTVAYKVDKRTLDKEPFPYRLFIGVILLSLVLANGILAAGGIGTVSRYF